MHKQQDERTAGFYISGGYEFCHLGLHGHDRFLIATQIVI